MLDAICIYDKTAPVTYTVFKFQKLSDQNIERFRQALICPACHEKAYFRRPSKDGRSACFGSRYHHNDCIEFKPSTSKAREELAVIEVNQQLVDSEALIIDFTHKPLSTKNKLIIDTTEKADAQANKAAGIPISPLDTDDISVIGSPTPQTNAETDGELTTKPLTKVATQGLEKLLLSLLRGSELAESDLWVYTDKKYRWRAKNLFVNFSEAEPTENGAPRMYWGTLSHSDKKMHWLNPADCKDVAIPIEEYQQALLSNFEIQDRGDFEGAGMMIFGKCVWNRDKTRKIIQLWSKNVNRVVISKVEN